VTELQKGKYKLVVTHEKQGFGCTWVAIAKDDHGNESNCTIYTADRSLSGDENYGQFIQQMTLEAKAIASVSHPNFPEMEFFQENDVPYLMMRSLTGTSLKDKVVRGQPMDEQKAIAYFRGMIEALQELHKLKTEHHNIQPSQIIFTDDDDRAILTGFVPARQIMPASTSRGESTNAYVPYYNSKIDVKRGAQDVYAIGATLYYAVTSQLPESYWKRKEADQDTLRPPIEWNSRLSIKLNSAILQAMSLDAKSRPLLRNWLDVLPEELNSSSVTKQAPIIRDIAETATTPPRVPVGWLLWNGTASVLLSLLLSATLTTYLTGLTWVALIVLTGIFGFTLSRDRTVRSWANVMSLVFLSCLFAISLQVLPAAFWQLPIVGLVLLAGYLTWKQEWFRITDWQRDWAKLCDRTRDNLAGYPIWQRYAMLIGTNWFCLILGKIIWGLALSQGLKQ
jgi:serine/threonine protein kinase